MADEERTELLKEDEPLEFFFMEIMPVMNEKYAEEVKQTPDGSLLFNLSGREAADYVLSFKGGVASVTKGSADEPTTTIKADSDVYRQIVMGQINGQQAFMMGQVMVEGDMGYLMRLLPLLG